VGLSTLSLERETAQSINLKELVSTFAQLKAWKMYMQYQIILVCKLNLKFKCRIFIHASAQYSFLEVNWWGVAHG
jgi:hypothetical protein